MQDDMTNYGQAALEFLTTYGWAFMVILIMISALGYFGVLNPGQFVPERCQMGQEFDCSDFTIRNQSGGDLEMRLSVINNVGQAIDLQGLEVDTTPNEITNGGTCSASGTVDPRAETIVNCSGITGEFPSPGNKQRLPFELTYQEVDGNFNHTITGSVMATIQG